MPMELLRYLRGSYSKQDKDELRDDPKHPVHYILSWIAYIDDYYKIY